MSSSLKFTIPRLRGLFCPMGKPRAFFQDTGQPELLMQVTRVGTKSYYGRGWNPAKGYTEKKPIGKFEQIDLRDARKRAREIAAQLALGKDPDAERKALRQDITFAEAFEPFITAPMKRKKKGPRREKTTQGYHWQYERYVAGKFGSKRLSAIHRSEIDDFHSNIGKSNGKYIANRVVTLISGVFNDAIMRGWTGNNPAQGIERFQEKKRKRFLREDEIGPFIKACEAERESGSCLIADAVLLALFTGHRTKNVCSAAWQEFNFERGTWSIPGDKMKNREPHVAYLSRYIKAILLSRYKDRTCDQWLFPSTGKTGHLVEPKKGIKRFAIAAKIDPQGICMHSLKHTFTTYSDDLGLASAVRKRLASHKDGNDVTSGYTHALERRVREAYEKVAQHMLGFARE